MRDESAGTVPLLKLTRTADGKGFVYIGTDNSDEIQVEKGETVVVNLSTVRFVRWNEQDYHEAGPVPKAFYGFGG
jgi:hypothetical protein